MTSWDNNKMTDFEDCNLNFLIFYLFLFHSVTLHSRLKQSFFLLMRSRQISKAVGLTQKSAIMAKSENTKIWIVTYNSSDSPISTRFSDFYTILRFFRLYDSSDCYSAIFLILLVLHDSPIFPIIRFFWLLNSDFSDSPSSTRFSAFFDYTILPS